MNSNVAEGWVTREPLLRPEVRRVRFETPRPCAPASKAVNEDILNQRIRRRKKGLESKVAVGVEAGRGGGNKVG